MISTPAYAGAFSFSLFALVSLDAVQGEVPARVRLGEARGAVDVGPPLGGPPELEDGARRRRGRRRLERVGGGGAGGGGGGVAAEAKEVELADAGLRVRIVTRNVEVRRDREDAREGFVRAGLDAARVHRELERVVRPVPARARRRGRHRERARSNKKT